MAVNNSLQKQESFNTKAVEFECNGEKVKLSPQTVRNYLVNGNGNVTDQEIVMFLNLCKYQHLNPYLREAYLVKYSDNLPATIVVGKDAFTKRARRNKGYKGNQAGVIVMNKNGVQESRIGALVLKDEEIIGGWAKVFIEGDAVPTEISISFDEYAGRKKDGQLNSQWASKPATMVRKVALVQALREAFPEDFEGMYSAEEIGIDDDALNHAPIQQSAPQEISQAAEAKDQVQDYDPLAT